MPPAALLTSFRNFRLLRKVSYWVYLDAGNRVQRTGQGMELPMRLFDRD